MKENKRELSKRAPRVLKLMRHKSEDELVGKGIRGVMGDVYVITKVDPKKGLFVSPLSIYRKPDDLRLPPDARGEIVPVKDLERDAPNKYKEIMSGISSENNQSES